jgi:hypothetical protein
MRRISNMTTSLMRAAVMIAWAALAASCAKVVSPSGGPKDTDPPVAVSIDPPDKTIRFQEKEISIAFNEMIQLKNRDQILISPSPAEQPEIRVKGKKISVSFQGSLKANTTYTVNFGNAVADVNEGNEIPGFQYVFSTGDKIDSSELSGEVVTANYLSPAKNHLVMIYADTGNDSLPLKNKPDYFSRTNEKGTFSIPNIPERKYKVFALRDANANFIFDQPNESVAFIDSAVSPEKKAFMLHSFEEEPRMQNIIQFTNMSQDKYLLVFKKPVQRIYTQVLNASGNKRSFDIKEYSSQRDSVVWWYTGIGEDTLHAIIVDKINQFSDTVSILVKKSDEKKSSSRRLPKLTAGIVLSKIQKTDYFKPAQIIFSEPVVSVSSGDISLASDSTPVPFVITPSDSSMRKFSLEVRWKENAKYRLLMPKGCLTGISHAINDSLTIDFSTSEESQYGSLTTSIQGIEKNKAHLLQLLDENDHVIENLAMSGDTTHPFRHMMPGKYRLRIIRDSNGNGKWDTGNYLKKIQPEKVFMHPDIHQIRANWDIELKWNLSE